MHAFHLRKNMFQLFQNQIDRPFLKNLLTRVGAVNMLSVYVEASRVRSVLQTELFFASTSSTY